MTNQKKFFLGGSDAEMVRIAEILTDAGVSFEDAGLGWGAKASAYGAQIAQAVEDGFTPVLVELELDCDVPEGAIVVDHHGDRASEPASILQVLSLLGREPTRLDQLIGANDSGYISAMLALGASAEEIARVRGMERSAQGISAEQEAEAERAIAAPVEMIGEYRVIRMGHSKTSPVTDRLFDPACPERLLILSNDGEVNFYGRGDLCAALKEKFEGWGGGQGFGSAEGNGFWGGYPSHEDVVEFLRQRVQ